MWLPNGHAPNILQQSGWPMIWPVKINVQHLFSWTTENCYEGSEIEFFSRLLRWYIANNNIKHLSRALSSITRQIWGIWKLRPAYSSETHNLGQNRWCFVPCDLEIWWMTLENNRASLPCCFKLCATFHSHWWIQTGVTVRKRPIGVKFDEF